MADHGLTSEQLDSYTASIRQEYETMLGRLVEIPTVSADSEHAGDIERGASLASQYLQDAGASVEVVETPGNPVVLGKLLTDPANPTITIYNHMDVQPAQEPEWVNDPFSFHIEDDRYEGRGCTDDKGPALTALFAARYAVEKGTPINIHFVWELEEEIGSPNFEHFIRSKVMNWRLTRSWYQTLSGFLATPRPSPTAFGECKGQGWSLRRPRQTPIPD